MPEPGAPNLVEATDHFTAPSSPESAAIGFGSVWVTAYRGSYVIRIDPSTNAVVTTIPMPPIGLGGDGSTRMVVGPHGVWLGISQNTTTGVAHLPSELLRIDPATNAVTSHMDVESIYGVVDGPDGLWAGIDPQEGTASRKAIVQLDPNTGAKVRTVDLGPASSNPTYWPELDDVSGSLWVVTGDDTIARVDPSTGTVTATIHTPSVLPEPW